MPSLDAIGQPPGLIGGPLCRRVPAQNLNGTPANRASIPDDRRYLLSQRTVLLRADEAALTNDYLAQYLRSARFQRLMRQQSSGTTATGIQRAKLEPLPIEYPKSTEEQSKIAEILSTVDRAIEQTEALIAKQQRICP